MAFVDPNQPQVPALNAQQQQQAPVAAGGAGVSGAGKPAASTPGVNVPAQPSAQLSSYLSANKPQAEAFAGQVAGQVGSNINAAGQAIQPAVNAYTGNLYNVPTDANVNQAVATAPSTLTPEQKATYQTELGAAANVPNSANTFEASSGYTDLAKGIENAVSNASLWNSGNSIPNISSALQPFESPSSTEGVRTLDSLLLSQSPTAYSKITGAVAPAADLPGALSSATQSADAALSGAISTDQATTAAAKAAPEAYLKSLSDYLASATTNASTTSAKILADLNSGALTPEDIATLGMTPEKAQALVDQVKSANDAIAAANMGASGINLSSYLTQLAPTAENLATPKQYSDVATLQELLGASAPVFPINAATAGSASSNLNNLNYSSALQGASTAYQIATLQQQAEALAAQANAAIADYQANSASDVHGVQAQSLNQQIAEWNAQIQTLNDQISTLSASAPGIFAGNTGVGETGTGSGSPTDPGALGGTLTDAGSVILPTLGVPIISGIGDLAGDIGGFFGLAEGGEVRKMPKNLKEYIGAPA